MRSKRSETIQLGTSAAVFQNGAFLFVRADISQVRLHPNFTNTKVACAAAEGHQRPVEVPGGELIRRE